MLYDDDDDDDDYGDGDDDNDDDDDDDDDDDWCKQRRFSVRKTNEGLLPTDGQSTSLLESREKVLKKIRNTNLKIEVEDNAHCNMANKKFSKEQGNIQTYSYASEVNDSDNAPLGHIRRSLLVGPLAR